MKIFAAVFVLLLPFVPVAHGEQHPDFRVSGFATVPAYGAGRVSGGEGGPVVEVRTAQQFRDALERADVRKKAAQHESPRVVKVMADIDLGELANERGGKVLTRVGKVEVRSHTTLVAPGAGATIRHGVIEIKGAANVIIRNLRFRDLWEPDPTEKYDRYGWDFVRVTSSGKDHLSHHVWIDHCDFGKCYDGQVDITHGSDLVTVSWCRFAGDERGPHHKSILIGHSSSDNAAALDRGKLNVTLHHNAWTNILDRAPRVRFGNVHCFNNEVAGAENGTIAVMGAVALVENCVYRDTRVATTFSHARDTVSRNHGGTICLVDSRNDDPRPAKPEKPVPAGADDEDDASAAPPTKQSTSDADRAFELANNFKGNVGRSQLQFNVPAAWQWENRNALPYRYTADPVTEVSSRLSQWAGVGKLPDPELVPSR